MRENFFAARNIFSSLIFLLTIFILASCDLSFADDIKKDLESGIEAEYTFLESEDDPESKAFTFGMKISTTKSGSSLFPDDITLFDRGKRGFRVIGWKYIKNPLDGTTGAPENFSFDSNGYVTSVTISPQPAVLAAVWEAPYIVRHNFQNLMASDDGSYGYGDVIEERLYGKVGTETVAEARSVTGFLANTFSQVEINDEGTTEVDIYYDRESYTYIFDLKGGSTTTALGSGGTLTGRYGESLSVASPTQVGYRFSKWQPPLPTTFQPGYSGFIAVWWSGTTTYTVRHNKQHLLDNGYDVEEEEEEGPTEEYTDDTANEYEGFTAQPFDQVIIKGDGSTILNIYYNRNTIYYTFNLDGGSTTTNLSSAKQLSGRYGASFTINDPSRTGYTFAGWNQTLPSTFGSVDATFTALWTANVYPLTFNSNGGSGTMADQDFTYGLAQLLNANAFTKSGYVFAG